MNVAAAAMDFNLGRESAARNPLHHLENIFASNCLSSRREQMESSQLFGCQELTGHTNSIFAMKFSDDGNLLVSGGGDETVRLWSINEGCGEWNSTKLETKHDDVVLCLAFSPDNRRISSGVHDTKVLIHDTNTLAQF